MSRIGKNPVAIPQGVTVDVAGRTRHGQGQARHAQARRSTTTSTAAVEDGKVVVTPQERDQARAHAVGHDARARQQHGERRLARASRVNLEINGVGYRAAVQGKDLVLQLGYSHDVNFPIPDDIKIVCEKPTAIAITGADRQRVGQVAAEIRALPQARALQGQGHQVRDRDDPPQGRQEEVGAAAMTQQIRHLFARRQRRVRHAARARRRRRGRGCRVFRSSKHIYAQVIDDAQGAHRWPRPRALDEALRDGAQDRRQQGRGRRGRQAASPSAPRPPASRPSCSIAAAICFMAGSRPWPTPPARAASTF